MSQVKQHITHWHIEQLQRIHYGFDEMDSIPFAVV